MLSDAALGRELGAEYYVASLRQAVEACLKAEQTYRNSDSDSAAA